MSGDYLCESFDFKALIESWKSNRGSLTAFEMTVSAFLILSAIPVQCLEFGWELCINGAGWGILRLLP